ncbi:hypothetical protein EGW08_020385 [Elysia chlorotica]|uniref:Protein FAM177A1 n=1 Tax=Elysia chlorotica TaxID=188477 RepID=A0A3S1B4M5_ELYCH|nr:hypothetical protein EGW08_020385 [Elysia chlorotica]
MSWGGNLFRIRKCVCDNMANSEVSPAPGDQVNTTSFDIDLLSSKKTKVPKRIIHFSDGILEEYSSDDSDDSEDLTVKVDPSSLNWGPWCMYYIFGAARQTLSVADYCGERLAWLLGITTPKYQYAINEHNRIQKEIEMETIKKQQLQEEIEGISSIDVKIVGGQKKTGFQGESDGSEGAEKY